MLLYIIRDDCVFPNASHNQVMIDDFGLTLSPRSVRDRLCEYRQIEDLHETEDETFEFVLVTRSIPAMNWFARELGYESVMVWCPATDSWISITDELTYDFLAHFALGDLYLNGHLDIEAD
jgi:hypothetical protein